ncbi:hypothetical protein D3C83_229430 [compost metagenome]
MFQVLHVGLVAVFGFLLFALVARNDGIELVGPFGNADGVGLGDDGIGIDVRCG